VVNLSVDNMVKYEYYIHNCSLTVAEGEDSVDHINRLITSNIKTISNLESIDTLVCNANGRITDSLQILRIEEQILLLGNEEAAENTRKLIVSGVHWNEDVRIMNGDGILSKISIFASKDNLNRMFLEEEVNEEPNKWINVGDKYLTKTNYGDNSKLDIVMKSDEIMNFVDEKMGADSCRINIEDWNRFRVLNGIMSFDEYKHDLLPSELGLDKFVDLKKGCYPGQEIHARLESRGKLKKKIKKFKSNNSIESGKHKSKLGRRINITTSLGRTGFFLTNNLEEETIEIDNSSLEYEELDVIEIC